MDKLLTQEVNCNTCGKKVKIKKYKGKVDPYTCSKCRPGKLVDNVWVNTKEGK